MEDENKKIRRGLAREHNENVRCLPGSPVISFSSLPHHEACILRLHVARFFPRLQVRALAEYARKRDKRVIEYQRAKEAERQEKEAAEAARRRDPLQRRSAELE